MRAVLPHVAGDERPPDPLRCEREFQMMLALIVWWLAAPDSSALGIVLKHHEWQ